MNEQSDAEPHRDPDDTKVICPNCTHQFRAISVMDQARLAQSDAQPDASGLIEAARERDEFLMLCDRLFHNCPFRVVDGDETLELTNHQADIFTALSRLTYRHGKQGPADARSRAADRSGK